MPDPRTARTRQNLTKALRSMWSHAARSPMSARRGRTLNNLVSYGLGNFLCVPRTPPTQGTPRSDRHGKIVRDGWVPGRSGQRAVRLSRRPDQHARYAIRRMARCGAAADLAPRTGRKSVC